MEIEIRKFQSISFLQIDFSSGSLIRCLWTYLNGDEKGKGRAEALEKLGYQMKKLGKYMCLVSSLVSNLCI